MFQPYSYLFVSLLCGGTGWSLIVEFNHKCCPKFQAAEHTLKWNPERSSIRVCYKKPICGEAKAKINGDVSDFAKGVFDICLGLFFS